MLGFVFAAYLWKEDFGIYQVRLNNIDVERKLVQ